VARASTVTLAATVAATVLLLDIVTAGSRAGAGSLNVTSAVCDPHLVTLVGLSATDDKDREGGFTVRVAVWVPPLKVPEIVTAVRSEARRVGKARVARVAPAATVTIAGTVAASVLLLAVVTAAPRTSA